MKYFISYVRSAHKQVYKELDKPLYKDFVNDATGALADIRLDEITTENTFRMEVHNEIRSAGYPRYVNAVNYNYANGFLERLDGQAIELINTKVSLEDYFNMMDGIKYKG